MMCCRLPRLPSGLAVGLALLLAACGGGGTGSPPNDSTLVLVSSTPVDGAQSVPLDQEIRVVFSDALDVSQLHPGTVKVGAPGSGQVEGSTTILDDGQGRTLVWRPTSPLFPDASHQCAVDDSLRSASGSVITGRTTFTFRTMGETAPAPLPAPQALRETAGRLNVGRRSHTATLLQDGRVLVAGGFVQGTSITDRAEAFDGEYFTLLAEPMVQQRASHTATRLQDGRVLLTGGWYESTWGQISSTARAEIFDPETDTFYEVEEMNSARVDHRAILLPDGRVLITGGSRLEEGSLVDLESAEVFDPEDESFTLLPASMVHSRATHVMEDAGNGRIYLVGGSDTDIRPEFFDVASETFAPLSAAAQDSARFGAMGAAFATGGVCVAGGDNLGTVLYVKPGTGLVQNTGSGLDRPRAYGTATRIDNDRILVAGGFDLARGFFMLHTIDLVVEGGIGGSRTYATELRFSVPLALHTATRLSDGRVLFCGGLSEENGQLERDDAFVFTP